MGGGGRARVDGCATRAKPRARVHSGEHRAHAARVRVGDDARAASHLGLASAAGGGDSGGRGAEEGRRLNAQQKLYTSNTAALMPSNEIRTVAPAMSDICGRKKWDSLRRCTQSHKL